MLKVNFILVFICSGILPGFAIDCYADHGAKSYEQDRKNLRNYPRNCLHFSTKRILPSLGFFLGIRIG